jgi:hypothetical protein
MNIVSYTNTSFQPIPLRKTLQISLFLGGLLVALATHPYARNIALVGLAVWSLLSTKQAIQALSLLMLIKFLNPAVYPIEGSASILGWIVIATAGARIFVDNLQVTWKIQLVLLWLFIFSLVIFLESVFFSYHRVVSIFKVLSFTYAAVAVLLGFKATARQAVNWTPWFLGIWITVTVLSIPTFFLPEIGFFRDEMGFQGILDHPQTFAVFLSPMVAWFMGRILFSLSKGDYWLYAMLPLAWASLFLTRGRTALVAVISGFMAVLLIGLIRRSEWRKLFRRAMFHPILLILVLACLAIALFQPPAILEAVSAFIFKDVPDVVVAESFEQSRGFLVVESMNNFAKNHWFGIGFGVSQSNIFPFEPIIEPLTGLPLSAPTEKPMLPVALLEETGIMGTTIFTLFLFALMKLVISKRDLILSLVFFTCLFVNIGEMIFFSAGGMGLYIWLLMAWASYSRFERYSEA